MYLKKKKKKQKAVGMHVTISIFVFFLLFSYLYRLVAGSKGNWGKQILKLPASKSTRCPICLSLIFFICAQGIIKTPQYKVKRKSLPLLVSVVPLPRGKPSVGFLIPLSIEGGEFFLIWFLELIYTSCLYIKEISSLVVICWQP